MCSECSFSRHRFAGVHQLHTIYKYSFLSSFLARNNYYNLNVLNFFICKMTFYINFNMFISFVKFQFHETSFNILLEHYFQVIIYEGGKNSIFSLIY